MQYRDEESPIDCNIIDPNNQPWNANWGNPEHFNLEGFQHFIHDNYDRWEFPEDYIDQTLEDICNQQDFALSQHQKLLGQWINPKNPEMKGCLIWHGLGSGKTCTATVIKIAWEIWNSNNYQQKVPRRVIVVTPKALKSQWETELFKQSHCASQCIDKDGEPYIPDDYTTGQEIKDLLQGRQVTKLGKREKEYLASLTDEKKLNKLESTIRKKKNLYDIVTHKTFLNELISCNEMNQCEREFRLLKKKRSRGKRKKKESINLLDPNILIIIDEVHKLVSTTGKEYRKLIYALEHYMHESTTMVLLSATPLFDSPVELGLTLNLLRPTIPFPSEREMFQNWFQNNDKNGPLNNKKLFQLMAAGYVSYFSGGNPNAYPDKIITFVNHKLEHRQEQTYADVLASKLQEMDDSNIDRNEDPESHRGHFEINAVMGDHEANAGWMTPLLQIANIALPSSSATCANPITTNVSNDIKAQNSARTKLNQLLRNSRDENIQIHPGLSCFKTQPIFHLENLTGFDFSYPENEYAKVIQCLNNFSSKYAWILNSILTTSGTVFIYTSWVAIGADVWRAILTAIGWEEWSQNNPTGKFFIWSGKSDPEVTNAARIAFNQGDPDGNGLRVLIGTRSVTEGVDLKNTQTVHISDPWWNESRIEQIIARAIRRCSHINQPGATVMVYRHTSVLSDYPNRSRIITDALSEKFVLEKGTRQNLHINSAEIQQQNTALRKLVRTNTFRSALKEIALDCHLMRNGNIIKLYYENTPIYESNGRGGWLQRGYQTTLVDPSDYSHWIIQEEREDKIVLLQMEKVPYDTKFNRGFLAFKRINLKQFRSTMGSDDDLDIIIRKAFDALSDEEKEEYATMDRRGNEIIFKWDPIVPNKTKIIDSNKICRENINCYTGELNLDNIDLEPEMRYQVMRQFHNYDLFRRQRNVFQELKTDDLLMCLAYSYDRSSDPDYKRKIDRLKDRKTLENERKDKIKKLRELNKSLADRLELDPNISIGEIETEIERERRKGKRRAKR